ncbi:uncharacterized protein K452DRAFT_293187 [Aplosporella prunicola CBS 121167]|uniref:F-box domain-containing protein n=1 Tax=Aplosporella prunicola CBS 121167 TaxID=1176127 RepID=A0A6A6AX18_9PEZI|nr:uncharacterized protein K452DRAFT_293187 [Aplosporella prunicola CBS 121167]KAF2135474.1 hypothetical protein K452DRAFT_293187 [Aplosporella prunicola CBS 121167]
MEAELTGLTYPRLNLRDYTLDDNNLAIGCPLDNGHHIRDTPQQNLGVLDALPLELLHMMVSQLDLRTLTDFRRINRRAMQVVDSVPQYKAITTHASNALRGILAIETGRWITCETLYDKLCTAQCERCGDFGGYLYLLTCKRVCFLCLSEDGSYLPLRYSHAIKKFGITPQAVKTLPRMRSITGIYSPNEKKSHRRLCLVDFETAFQAGIELHGSQEAMERCISSSAQEGAGSTTHWGRRTRTKEPFDGKSSNVLRFLAIVYAPALNRVTLKLERGFYCIGCQRSYGSRPKHFRRRFTEASFKEHLEECGNIQDGYHVG